MKLRTAINYSLSLLLGLVFIWLTFKGIDFEGLKAAFGHVSWWYLLLYLVILTGIQIVRTTRWGVMLEPVKKVPFRTLYAVSSVGFMALVLLPFRLGEFARPILIHEKGGVHMSAAMATVVVERVLDAITISVLLMVTIIILASGGFQVPDWLVNSGVIFFLVFFSMLVVCIFMYLRPALIEKVTGVMLGWASPAIKEKANNILHQFINGLKILPDWKRLLNIFVQSMIYWGLNATGLYVMFIACDLRDVRTGEMLPYIAAYALLCMQVVGISIPSGPAFTGPFDYFTAITVSMFAGMTHSAPAVQLYVILVHGLQLAQQSLFGLVYVLTGYVSFGSLVRRSGDMEEFVEPT
ncbi:MAG: lysylphosphatidylglycerol synthase transmembrane domain-containing protein [Myxococcota bacterium]|jgi:hypothetical protein